MWARRPRLPHTHTDSQDHCAQDGRDTIDIWLCTRTRHRDGVDMPDAGLHPHREAMHKQHTEPGPSCCVPLGDPHVHKVAPSGETRQGCSHSSANTLSPCLTSCCPCRGAPAQVPRQRQHEVRQGDTHDSGSAAIRGDPLPNTQRKIIDGPLRVKVLRLGGQSGSS